MINVRLVDVLYRSPAAGSEFFMRICKIIAED